MKLVQGIPRYRLDEPEAMPVISQDSTADLRWDDGRTRLWLHRTRLADGEPFERTVTVEIRNARTGTWDTHYLYDATRPMTVTCPGGC